MLTIIIVNVLMNYKWIETKKFRDKRTGKIVTQFSIFDIEHMEEVE